MSHKIILRCELFAAEGIVSVFRFLVFIEILVTDKGSWSTSQSVYELLTRCTVNSGLRIVYEVGKYYHVFTL